jgi:hypothetical protein
MREERLKILSMLQEGKITPEEAERLLSALSGPGRSESGEWGGHGRRGRGCCDFEFDFAKHIDPELKGFGGIFNEDFRRKFEDKMRRFRHSMRWADEGARREARDGLHEAAESVKEALNRSNIKETVESVGKTVLDALEEAMRHFGTKSGSDAGGTSPKGPTPEQPKKPDGEAGTSI